MEEVHAGITMLCDEVVWRLRNENKKCTVVQLTIRDADFHTIQRQKKLNAPTWLMSDIVREATALARANWTAGRQIRMLTVTVSGLVAPDATARQLTLFDEPSTEAQDEKREKLEAALLEIRRKKGVDSIYLGLYDERELGLTNRKPPKGDENER